MQAMLDKDSTAKKGITAVQRFFGVKGERDVTGQAIQDLEAQKRQLDTFVDDVGRMLGELEQKKPAETLGDALGAGLGGAGGGDLGAGLPEIPGELKLRPIGPKTLEETLADPVERAAHGFAMAQREALKALEEAERERKSPAPFQDVVPSDLEKAKTSVSGTFSAFALGQTFGAGAGPAEETARNTRQMVSLQRRTLAALSKSGINPETGLWG